MCNGIMCQVTLECNCQNREFRTHRIRETAGSLLTFVRDLTFDLTFCRLFSFFLLKAFFPLKANSDTQFFHALHALLMVTAKHVFQDTFFRFQRKSRRRREPAILLHPRLRNDLLNIDPTLPVNITGVQVALRLEIVISKR